jgi:hypothetical protein
MTSEKWWELLETSRKYTTFKNAPDPFADCGDDVDSDDADPRTITLSSGMFPFIRSTRVDTCAKMSKSMANTPVFIKILKLSLQVLVTFISVQLLIPHFLRLFVLI